MDFLIQIDHSVFQFINQAMTNAWLDVFFPFITDLNKNPWFKLIMYSSLFSFYIHKYRKVGVLYFLGCVLTVGLTDWSGSTLIKKNVMRPRPFQTSGLPVIKRSEAHGSSFISNHASNMFSLATYTSAFFPPARYALFAVATLVAYSRVYNGVHYPLDVICGAMWGAGIALLFIYLVRSIAKRKFAT